MPADADGTWPGATLLDVVATVRADNERPFQIGRAHV